MACSASAQPVENASVSINASPKWPGALYSLSYNTTHSQWEYIGVPNSERRFFAPRGNFCIVEYLFYGDFKTCGYVGVSSNVNRDVKIDIDKLTRPAEVELSISLPTSSVDRSLIGIFSCKLLKGKMTIDSKCTAFLETAGRPFPNKFKGWLPNGNFVAVLNPRKYDPLADENILRDDLPVPRGIYFTAGKGKARDLDFSVLENLEEINGFRSLELTVDYGEPAGFKEESYPFLESGFEVSDEFLLHRIKKVRLWRKHVASQTGSGP